MPVTVRQASLEDIPALTELGAKFIRQAPAGAFWDGDIEPVAHALAGLIDNDQCLLVAVEDDKAIGLLAAVIAPLWFAPSVTVATELAWFVDEDHRGRAGVVLFNEFERWGRERGAKVGAVSDLPQFDGWSLDGFLPRKQYRVAERTSIRGLN